MNEVKLLPCPFCGATALEFCNCAELEECENYESCTESEYVAVVCNLREGGCGATGGYRKTEEEAADAWNRRRKPPNTPLTLEELRGMDGEPAFVVELFGAEPGRYWCVMDGRYAAIPGCDHFWHELSKYGETWIAYRRKPKEEPA